jgi:hypothetical protein
MTEFLTSSFELRRIENPWFTKNAKLLVNSQLVTCIEVSERLNKFR